MNYPTFYATQFATNEVGEKIYNLQLLSFDGFCLMYNGYVTQTELDFIREKSNGCEWSMS